MIIVCAFGIITLICSGFIMSSYDSVRHTNHSTDVLRFERTICGIITQTFDLEESLSWCPQATWHHLGNHNPLRSVQKSQYLFSDEVRLLWWFFFCQKIKPIKLCLKFAFSYHFIMCCKSSIFSGPCILSCKSNPCMHIVKKNINQSKWSLVIESGHIKIVG